MKPSKYLSSLKIRPKLLKSKLTGALVVDIQNELANLLDRKRETLERGLRAGTPIDYFHVQDLEEAIDVLNTRLLSYYSPMMLN